MSGFGSGNYRGDVNHYADVNQPGYSFVGSGNQLDQDLSFQSFASEQLKDQYGGSDTMYSTNPYLNPSSNYQGIIFTPSSMDNVDQQYMPSGSSDPFEDEPPLLEELGINPGHILQKTFAVMNPFRNTDADVLQDTDLAGPLVFCLAFGGFLLLSGKLHFNYIYGIGVLGCLGIYALLSLMATASVTLGVVVSVLGYCLLPMIGLAGVNVVMSLQSLIGLLFSVFAVLWCSISASKLFVTALSMERQQLLVAYPCALLYSVFALITVF